MLPHPPLEHRFRSTEEKPDYVNRLFDAGAEHYDGVVDWGFLCSGAAYRKWTLRRNGLRPGHQLLDVACGTGLVAVAAMKVMGGAEGITCLDPSEGMMAEAKKKLPARFVQGRAEQLPFPDNSFDFLTMGYALRHVTALETAFSEYRRVLKPGGRILIMEVTKPAGRVGRFFFHLYFGKIYPGLTQLVTRSEAARDMMKYFWETIDACVPPASVLQAMRNAGLTDAKRTGLLGLFSEYTATKN